jgi:hypothetical protein
MARIGVEVSLFGAPIVVDRLLELLGVDGCAQAKTLGM